MRVKSLPLPFLSGHRNEELLQSIHYTWVHYLRLSLGGGIRMNSMRLALAALLLAGVSHASVIRVDSNGSAPNPDGATWAGAFATIQAGIDAANSLGGGEVWVAAGTYAGSAGNPLDAENTPAGDTTVILLEASTSTAVSRGRKHPRGTGLAVESNGDRRTGSATGRVQHRHPAGRSQLGWLRSETGSCRSRHGGESFERGTIAPITWVSTGQIGDNINISIHYGIESSTIANGTPNDGAFDWAIPSDFPAGTEYFVEIGAVDDPGILDRSNATFTITDDTPPTDGTITVTSPNGGEVLQLGTVASITWDSTGNIGEDVKIYIRKGSGGTTVVRSTPNDGIFEWAIPSRYPTGAIFLIEISAVDDPTILDQSDDTFTLTD
jgi:hypothetical protein